ncbi:hypothetical protein PGT21_020159 [Puccinia graminis f. sp. tritici]|uniref:Uncharacterized protein n=1 Tax=Puccinia graminis f. sp. tritici TaxID=56615 RepID=A0A5B0PGQ8_PUCGR|nr:hypothetical protein PGT21_020159 [Puccinia graminis f. sp. tritici]
MSVLFSAQNPELHSKFSGDLFTIYKILDETILIACYFNLFTHVGKFPSRIMSHVHCYKRGLSNKMSMLAFNLFVEKIRDKECPYADLMFQI